MAPVKRSSPTEPDILLWNLWKMPDPGEAFSGERSRAASQLLSLRSQKIDSPAPLRARLTLPRTLRPGLGPLSMYSLLALTIMLPLLWPGFILTLDMAFTPELRMPEHMSSSYLFYAALHYLNILLPADVIQKIMLLGILLLSGLGAHLLMRHIQGAKARAGEFALWGAYIAGALYMINPFSYSRFMAGQFAVLLGYALLPFFAKALLSFLAVPTLRRSLVVAAWLAAIGIVSVHTLGLCLVLALAGLAVCAWRLRGNLKMTLHAALLGAVGLAVFVLASGYWLFPLLSGDSNQGQAISQFTAADRQAFQTAGADTLSQIGNALQLQGFWAEAEGLYLLPQEQLPGWALVVLLFWIVIGIGVRRLWRDNRAMAALFMLASLAAITVAILGAGEGRLLAGFREPHKFVGLLVLAYALFAGFGAMALLSWAKRRGDKTFAGAAVALLILPVLITPTMPWGFAGQLSPRQYPADWQAMNDRLNQDTDHFRVLSLPWHLYMHYPFAGRIIVNPSEQFFDKPLVASNELEFKDASPTFPNTAKRLLSQDILPNARAADFGEQLDDLNFKYVLLAKTYDYEDYAFLDAHADMQVVTETPNLKLYRNLAYE